MLKLIFTFCIAHLIFSFNFLVGSEKRFFSQFGQDKYLYENFFKEKRKGVFVDVGAHDGVTLSNTYFFEKSMEWSGICIEPIPEVFKRLKDNRKCICIEGCINDKYDTVAFLKVSGYAEMLSGIIENYNPLHVQRIQNEIRECGGNSEVIFVKCYPLSRLLIENNIKHVDYLSIDTEGGELEILQSIDFSQIDIDVIEVENNYGDHFQQFLKPLGYIQVTCIGCDEIYKKIRS